MKTKLVPFVVLLGGLIVVASRAADSALPETLPNGLTLVHKSKADYVYVRPDVDLGIYTKVILIEPTIAFRKNWKSDFNADRWMDRITDQDMANMIADGKKMLIEEFAKELVKGGFTLAEKPGAGVLAIQPAIVELDVYAPEPARMAGNWSKVYTDGAGEAIMELKLYDSKSGQLLLNAVDKIGGDNNGYRNRTQRTRVTNEADARFAFANWAQMLVEGLNKSKAAAKKP